MFLGLPRTVVALGLVSLCMDTSSEMIHSLLPLYLVAGLGASAAMLGLLEGIAEATASLRKALGENTSGVAGFLAHAAQAFGYSHLLVIDATGRIVLTLDDSVPLGSSVLTGGPASTPLASGFDRARTTLQTEFGTFQPLGRAGERVRRESARQA